MENTQSIILRPATFRDISDMIRLWLTKHAVINQAVVRPDPTQLTTQLMEWLQDETYLLVVGMREKVVMGFVIGHVLAMPTGLMSEGIGIVVDLTIDAHDYSGGLGRSLFRVSCEWFSANAVQRVMIAAPQRSAVEQAFWRSVGASYRGDLFWINI